MALSTRARRAAHHRVPFLSLAVPVASVDAATATENNEPLAVFEQGATIHAIQFIPDANRAGADTDSRTMVVRNVGDDALGDDDVASFAQVESADLTAYVPQALSVDPDEAEVAAGDVLVYRSVKVGSGVITPAGTFVIWYS